MMNYELFKEMVEKEFINYMPQEFKDFKLDIQQVNKINRSLDSLTVVTGDVSPNIYINDLYEKYKECEDFQKVLRSAAKSMTYHLRNIPKKFMQCDYSNAKDNLIMIVINTEQNQKMLSEVPHREFLDLSIVYRWIINRDDDGLSGSILNNHLAEKLGLTEEKIYQLAVENTIKLFPPVVKKMEDILLEIFVDEGMSLKEAETIVMGSMPESQMYIISNEEKMYGAAAMLYENELYKLATSFKTNLYILPSSIHELIAVPANVEDPNELAEMVAEININQVALDERLSNQVYYYDKDLRKISLATDILNKRVD